MNKKQKQTVRNSACQHIYGTFLDYYMGGSIVKYATKADLAKHVLTDKYNFCPYCGKKLSTK